LKKKVAIIRFWPEYFIVEGLTGRAPDSLSEQGAPVLQEFQVQTKVIFRGNSGMAFARFT
jgi:hypothetical protein